jgi:DNA-binding NarL/FixJ family response regulator
MAHGYTNSGIARRLFVSTKTVEGHVGCIFEKLDIHEQWGTNRRVLAVIRWLNQEADIARTQERSRISSDHLDSVSK